MQASVGGEPTAAAGSGGQRTGMRLAGRNADSASEAWSTVTVCHAGGLATPVTVHNASASVPTEDSDRVEHSDRVEPSVKSGL
jgi:hypothetical protein